ncbi:MAG TPA: CpsB/CapC family capsule biosynthesis tyrosine phosphatase [Gaiellaceae bacterium]|nr:CpsB/CapC family capsule biosynthesis tyrosine phosphatase [Gaiellaceae bacterium]
MFWDPHSHVVPSGDDGAQSLDEGLALCRAAAEHGTSVLFATPHVWPSLTLTPEREQEVREAHVKLAEEACAFGLDLRLGFELTPTPALLGQEPGRYRLGDLPAVLMELPFHGSLALAEALGEHIQGSGLIPVIAHPERSEAVGADPGLAAGLRERGWLLQANATSLLGYHGTAIEGTAWRLLREGLLDLVASDGHRAARPAILDGAFRLVEARLKDGARRLFDGSALATL